MKLLQICLILILLVSCTTSNKSISIDVKDLQKPMWIDNYPKDDKYYIGIGSSNSGNESEDRLIAEERALSNVASAISTKISSEVELFSEEDSDGDSYSYAKENITAVVEESLSGVETIDTFYSETSGSWIYMRLSKELWEQLQIEEMNTLINRITEFLDPSLNNVNTPFVSKILALSKAKALILESPYVGMLNTNFMGHSGAFIDTIDKLLKEYISSINLNVELKDDTITMGESLSFSISISSSLSKELKNFPITITKEDGSELFAGVVDEKGEINSTLDSKLLDLSNNSLRLSIDKEKLDLMASSRHISYPVKESSIDVLAIPVGLKIVIEPENVDILGLEGTIKSMFSSSDLPFKIVDKASSYLEVIVSISDFPKLDEDMPEIAKSKAVISLIKDGENVFSYESLYFKDAGLTKDQARNKSVSKLFKKINYTNEYVEGIKNALSVN